MAVTDSNGNKPMPWVIPLKADGWDGAQCRALCEYGFALHVAEPLHRYLNRFHALPARIEFLLRGPAIFMSENSGLFCTSD